MKRLLILFLATTTLNADPLTNYRPDPPPLPRDDA